MLWQEPRIDVHVDALNVSLAPMHMSWGLRPNLARNLARDLVRAVVLLWADYGVSCFLPLPSATFKPLEHVNESTERCDCASSAIYFARLPGISLPLTHCIKRLIAHAILRTPLRVLRILRRSKGASPLHFVKQILGVEWPVTVPAAHCTLPHTARCRSPLIAPV